MNWSVLPHPGGPLKPHDLWTAWNTEPSLLVLLSLSILIYVWGIWNVWRRAGTGRGITIPGGLSFLGAILALLVALVSPLDALSSVLFSAHMTQHLILVLVAAPLLVLSDFGLAVLWILPRPSAQSLGQYSNQAQTISRIWRVIGSPVCAWLLFTITLWMWHAPRLYQAALQSEALHDLEHFVFLVTAMLFWWVLVKHTGQKHLHYGMAIPYLFTTILHSGILGALMTFTSEPWYSYYETLTPLWGLTALQDQQLAGLIMWIPGGAVFTLLTIGYFAAWLRVLEQRSARLQHRDSFRTRQELK
jgi:putative membrane protein